MKNEEKTILYNHINKQKGITLIALVITIIIVMILAAVAMSLITGEEGLFSKANHAATIYNKKAESESVLFNSLMSELDKYSANGSSVTTGGEEDKTENIGNGLIGCYADIDGDGDIDGIIYADLLAKKSGKWDLSNEMEYSTGDGIYTINTDVTKSNVKEYIVSETAVTDSRFDSTPRYVVSPASNASGKKDRFYVMALEDITNGTYDTFYWYNTKNIDEMVTSEDFGTGKTNTDTMIDKWDKSDYGSQNDRDLWKNIKTKVNEGWFLPSIGEWCAFCDVFNICGNVYVFNNGKYEIESPSNNSIFHLANDYWTSSQFYDDYEEKYRVCYFSLEESSIIYTASDFDYGVRLSTTF